MLTRHLRAFSARLIGLFGGNRADAEVREEFESHLAMRVEENLRRGMTPEDARREALLDSGGLTAAAEAVRERRGLPTVDALRTDLRFAVRTLWFNRGYSLAVIATLALGIGANAAMFSIVNAVVLRPLPYPDPDRIVSLTVRDDKADRGVVDEHSFAEWARSARSVAVAINNGTSSVFTFPGGAEEIDGRLAAANYFDVIGVRPMMGRVFTADEDRPGGPSVVVISEQLWRRAFAADASILGKTVQMNDRQTTIIGVMPASVGTSRTQFWRPMRFTPSSGGSTFYYGVTGRLRDNETIETARAELTALMRRVEATNPNAAKGLTPVVMTLHERRYGASRTPLLLLFGAVGVLLLIACANIANLSLARATRREREFAVRTALGASRGRLMQQAMVESVLLSAIGAAIGLALSTSAVAYFSRLSPSSVANVEHIRVDGSVLGFTLLVAVATGVLFGLVPVLSARRIALNDALSNGSPRSTGGRRVQWVRRGLVVAQLATALVLLTGAGLVTRTFWRVTSIDPGFRVDHMLVAQVNLPRSRYTATSAAPFFAELIARVRRAPGVEAAGYSDAAPLSGVTMTFSWSDNDGKKSPPLDALSVEPGYFETIGARLVEGRFITEADKPGAPKAVVINETAARTFFPGRSALGQRMSSSELTVVGVVKDFRQRALEAVPTSVGYLARAQDGGGVRTQLVVRTAAPEALETFIRQTIRSLDPALVPPTITTMEQTLSESVAPRRFLFTLLALFAGLAATLAVVGLYGVLAYLVAERTREIGIRVALGADARRVRRLIIGQGMTLTAVGVVLGLAASIAAVRTLRTMMYDMSVYDTRTFVAGAVLLGGVAFLASWVPARRAGRVDPMTALRAE
jgi:predicted permease